MLLDRKVRAMALFPHCGLFSYSFNEPKVTIWLGPRKCCRVCIWDCSYTLMPNFGEQALAHLQHWRGALTMKKQKQQHPGAAQQQLSTKATLGYPSSECFFGVDVQNMQYRRKSRGTGPTLPALEDARSCATAPRPTPPGLPRPGLTGGRRSKRSPA